MLDVLSIKPIKNSQVSSAPKYFWEDYNLIESKRNWKKMELYWNILQ